MLFSNLVLFYLIPVILALPDQSQSCISNLQIPFTGYKVEFQLQLQPLKSSYHLLYCNDNKLIYDVNLNGTIPWTKPVTFYRHGNVEDNLILARRKTFALRSIPIFLPNTLVGSLYYGDKLTPSSNHNSTTTTTKSMPLIAANIFRNWCEINYKFQFIYHIPILTTPSIDSKRYSFGFFDNKARNDWNKYISMSEDYNFDHDSRVSARRNFDMLVNQLNLIIHEHELLGKRIKLAFAKSEWAQLWWSLVLISKSVKASVFNKLMQKLDAVLPQSVPTGTTY
ncbi:uncharacterized protein LODBEIA_P24310 [Lodderomyces beijingensis]|uniref:Uncharacterized protein n=1 Tax=Lodderomyces beijingensis TaxID=1775926 RepID=A0ABP0ZPU5_9ASCO